MGGSGKERVKGYSDREMGYVAYWMKRWRVIKEREIPLFTCYLMVVRRGSKEVYFHGGGDRWCF